MELVDIDGFEDDFRSTIRAFVVRIVAAYLSNNAVPPTELPALLANVHAALAAVARPAAARSEAGPSPEPPTPAEIRKSIQSDGLISFIDGRSYKTLKRHLTAHGLTPERYRAHYGLPNDYPMTAPGYAAQRSEIAKAIQLGHRTA
ncbi:MucR family transcriptional regulator [Methylobacterium sp. J-026]|uniref:MucR family transcriptional regulator n=1 Tax=Methylobacterium sp. J-026 TaxID=2836624 RepID=UPI001FBBEF4D|nr:MucR family transcriptional regulator [Methylobacterium sp. J-026]MCJ2136567.1 MucR family transcriptional regulator [Methylobacterium sp. J-026]